MSLRARLQMTKLHHKLGFIKFIITSEVIIIVPLAKATLAETTLAEPTLTKTVPTKARLKSIKVVYQGLHHLVFHQLPPWSLNCRWVPFPYPFTLSTASFQVAACESLDLRSSAFLADFTTRWVTVLRTGRFAES